LTASPVSIPDRLPSVSQDRMLYLNRHIGELHTTYVLSFDGRLDRDRLRHAVRLAMDAEPVLGCRYVPGRRPYWERRRDLDSLDLCDFADTADLQHELASFVAAGMHPTKDPLLQARIVPGSGDTVLFKTSHLPVDGTAVKELIALVASLYRDGGRAVTPNLGSRGSRQLFRQIGWRGCLRVLHSTPPKPARNEWSFPVAQPEYRGDWKFAIRRLEPAAFDAMSAFGKRFDATLNDIFLATCFRALWRFLDFPSGIPQSVSFPTNMRRYLSSGSAQAMCNFIAVLNATLERVEKEPFEATLLRLRKSMPGPEARRDRGVSQMLWISAIHHLVLPRMEKLAESAQQKAMADGRTLVIFSNSGDLEAVPFDFGVPVTDAYRVVHPLFAPRMLIYVSSFRKRLTFTMTYPSRAYRCSDVERFFDTFVEELPAGAGAILLPATPQTVHPAPHLPNTK
jgi:NRPS condensation-like uncharacterized protein